MHRWSWVLNCWRLRSDAASVEREFNALKDQLQTANDANHLLQIELDDQKKKMKEHLEEHAIAKDGNRALLRFIHTRHRLNVKFDPASIRGALQRQENQ